MKLVCEIPDTTNPLACGEKAGLTQCLVQFSTSSAGSYYCSEYSVSWDGRLSETIHHYASSEARALAFWNGPVAVEDCVSSAHHLSKSEKGGIFLRLLRVTNATKAVYTCRHR